MAITRWKSLMFFASLLAVSWAAPAFAQGGKGKAAKPAETKKGEDEEMTFDAEEVNKTLVSKKMVRGEDFYKKAERAMNENAPQEQVLVYFQSATIYLKQVLAKDNREDSPDTKQKAQYIMGKCLYYMGYYSAAKNYFEKIVEQGDAHPYYKMTLKYLVSLQQKMPESAGILPLIGKYSEEYLESKDLEAFRSQLLYYLGRYHYIDGRLDKAGELFAKVPPSSKPAEGAYFLKAKIFEGITLVRLGKPVDAIKRFNAIILFAQKNPEFPEVRDYLELANLSLARVYYQAGRVAIGRFEQTRKPKFAELAEKYLKLSITFYEKIPQNSHNWLQSLFEESWSYFILDAMLRPHFKKDYGGFQKALGNIHTLNAPFFENQFFPESLILRAVIYFQNCRVESAQEALAEFGRVYPKLQLQVREVADKHKNGDDEDNEAYFEYIKKILTDKAGLEPKLSRLVKSSLKDRTFERRVEFLDELNREIKMLDNADKSWRSSDIAREIKEDLEFQKMTAQGEAGKLARDRVRRLDDELTRLVLQYGDVKIELNNLKLKKVTAKMTRQTTKVEIMNVVVDDEHVVWPFTGEYWQDELGYYRFIVRSTCGSN